MAKKKEPIVLNKTELMPTNLGSMKQKESGLIITVIIIVLFVSAILFLPMIEQWLNPFDNTPIPYQPIAKEEEETPPEEPETQVEKYYDLTDDLAITIQGFTFQNFLVNETAQTMSLDVINTTGSANYFVNKNYYIQYYSKTNELLGRSKLTSEEIVSRISSTYEISNVLKNGKIAKISIREIKEEEYPNVVLGTDVNGNYVLLCEKDNQTLTYSFTKSGQTYALEKIEETQMYSTTDEDYQHYLDFYNNRISSLKNTKGVQASLNPIVTGFEFILEADLKEISASDYQKNFSKDAIYYKEKTDAKQIAFEKSSSNYLCK